MALQLGPVIGKIGGADVTSTAITGDQRGTSWNTIHTVEVPDGETWLIVAEGMAQSSSSLNAYTCRLRIGNAVSETPSGPDPHPTSTGTAATGPASVPVEISNGNSNGTTTIIGTVYTAPLPD